ncbi:alpha-amylase [Dysgonomonas sp. 521]|uniref:alpha-amylase n=1 Tax=Dysgonomonas sp. 521 TaxID=2302932 RepID=UPI0013D6A1E9|nr:alpha-amylase [Dysgonomonas sp. 521]NDV94076.1 alpha-amylase [Dysgonomonas sp. 521]
MKNGVMMQYFEWNLPNDGNLWKKLKDDAKHLHEIGITAVWIPPAYKADEQQDEGYATYDLFDLGEFDQQNTVRTKYGTKAELKQMIDELHKYQISVYLDAVMNHKAEGDYTERFMVKEVDPKERTKDISDEFEIQAWTGYLFRGRNNKYSDFKWHWYHFSGVGFDDAKKRSGVFKVMGENKNWSEGVDKENGNYDFLLCNDLDLNHPEVINELNRWGVWVSKELDLDGMRLDAIKHMDDKFISQFLKHVRADRGEDFYAVGEYWNGDIETLDNYLESVGSCVDLFDVPLHYNMYEASRKGKEYDMQNLIKNSLSVAHAELGVTFVDNHDSQLGSSLESEVEEWFKPSAYGLILLMKNGYPCIFYGDYYGVHGEESPHREIIDTLLQARHKYAYGDQVDYFDHVATVGFVRTGDKDHPGSGLALLISNGEDGNKMMNVGAARKGEVWYDLTGNIKDKVVIDEDGDGNFLVEGGKLSVWVKE